MIFVFLLASFSFAESNEKVIDVNAYKNNISDCVKNKDYACALSYFTKWLQSDPRCIGCYLGSGILNYYLGNYQEAISFLNRTIEQSKITGAEKGSYVGVAYFSLGIVYDKLGKQERATEELTNAIRYFEDNGDWKMVFFLETMLEKIKRDSGNNNPSGTSSKK